MKLLPSALAASMLAATTVAADPAASGRDDATAAAAHPVKAVVELFTSQGCSSCPPADAVLKSYAESGDILALSFPIDYWDYIGWKDTFASPKNTERQWAYARKFGVGTVYTPQAIVNGTYQAVGSNKEELDTAIERSSETFARRGVPIQFTKLENRLVIDIGGAPGGSDITDATIWLVVLQRSASVSVKRGENSGRQLSYANVVREMTPVGVWNGRPQTLQLALNAVMKPEAEDSAVLIQEGTVGPIVGAALLGR